MGIGGVFLLLVVIVVVVLIVLVMTGNAGWLGWRGSDPERQGAPGTSGEGDQDGQPTHTAVDLDQSARRETRGKPVN